MSETNDLMQRFDRLQRKRDEANKNVIQLQAKIDSANEAINQIESGWKQTYGFSTYDEALAKLKELDAEISTTMATCEEYLKSVEDIEDGGSAEISGFENNSNTDSGIL